ncbi:TetR/AcrR family transcriptional regulator [Conexibacter woesei]|uniref:Transcriptional regulator, TetR family n=1 Tax=Conexibacter woesei (strain DSM 14684 / CCUG 47730 / CIP 108061 / JCM 11494 / NBRC 100937 / ID131577) TaxID=469383 RepID=D3FAJ6_CONWI|nr:TetR/AcrR family transcriptional regulator [Conexibacter woesei]ADB49265.1 transcriptional regulator, TetR family [Conexibacter woesei DSM 14684]
MPAHSHTPAADGRAATRRPPKRRAEIIERSAALFDARGYHSASMEDIAAAVGIRKTTLYHYFRSKDEILACIHDEFLDLLIERQQRRAALGMRPDQLVLETMEDILELMETHRGHVRVFFEHHRELPPDAHEAISRKRKRYEEEVRATIRDGVEQGAFRPVDPGMATLALFGMCNWAYQWYDASGPLSARQIAHTFWDMLLRGIASRPDGR